MNPAAWRVGVFALIGTVLLVAALVLVGGHWFTRTEPARVRFAASVQGLQQGAPVVFRGVRVGRVEDIGLAPPGPGGVLVPVTLSLDTGLLRGLLVEPPVGDAPVVPPLIAQGLVARLASPSLLTGLSIVELDFASVPGAVAMPAGAGSGSQSPARPPDQARVPAVASRAGPPLIPSAPDRMQSLQAQLEGVDLAGLVRDLQTSVRAVRTMVSDPQAMTALARAADAAGAVQQLAERLQRELPQLAGDGRRVLGETRGVLGDARRAIDDTRGALVEQTLPDVRTASRRAAEAAAQLQSLAAEAPAALTELRQASAEIGRVARVLQEAVAEDGGVRQNAERALQDVSRAARAVRALAEQLEQQPDALIRGRATADP
ncbi:MAG TPA: MlaD family protein [Quisquiliibacterium sp.]|nr:MlaD family protein [Quisquiliibacterium sp.]